MLPALVGVEVGQTLVEVAHAPITSSVTSQTHCGTGEVLVRKQWPANVLQPSTELIIQCLQQFTQVL